ncbi:DUF397 domain-containing protein [Plantactinospora soyae]|uniref:DUF397 domain-containing protein n=1 Tax=Plantactinospora soyae TaxID=1544732 RepID=A0A927QXR2_9ACTN|nr:DUF397 domain-containing protein [Plantactinospora soyae]MBE1485758.1 hypothetical protein [Plantactinospora soyae]
MTTTEPCWKKSTRSNAQAECVEFADDLGGVVGVRDSKDPAGPVLSFAPAAWQAFVREMPVR